jgi:hypothetical protein
MRLERIAGARMSLILLSLAACLAYPAWARDKTDVIVMKNGDRITGEIKRLENAVLTVSLDWVDGSISVNWLQVARIESKALFIVQLQDGTVYSARVISPEGPAPASLEIQPEGQELLVIEKKQVSAMTQTSEGFLKRFSGVITLGSTYSKGNSATQYNISSELDYTQTRWGGKVDYTSNLTSSTGASASTRNQLEASAYRLLRWKNYFYQGEGGFLQSSTQGIHRQASVGGGIGRFLKNTNRVRFSVLGGVGWQSTHYVPTTQADPVQDVAVGLISSSLQVFTFKRTTLDLNGSVAPAINAQGRVFSKVNASYYLKVFGKIDWNFSVYANWDTQPPPHLAGTDYGSSTGLSYDFGNK